MSRMTKTMPPALEEALEKKKPMRDHVGYYEHGFRQAVEICLRKIRKLEKENSGLYEIMRKNNARPGDWD